MLLSLKIDVLLRNISFAFGNHRALIVVGLSDIGFSDIGLSEIGKSNGNNYRYNKYWYINIKIYLSRIVYLLHSFPFRVKRDCRKIRSKHRKEVPTFRKNARLAEMQDRYFRLLDIPKPLCILFASQRAHTRDGLLAPYLLTASRTIFDAIRFWYKRTFTDRTPFFIFGRIKFTE